MEYKNIKTPEELLKFMDENITYGFVSIRGKKYTDVNSSEYYEHWLNDGTVQTGKEVLQNKIGTCWDQVELERLWFEENGYQFQTIFMWFEVNEINNLPTHTFLIYEKDNNYYWFEHAFTSYKGIHKFDSIEEAREYVKKAFLKDSIESGLANNNHCKCLESYIYNKLLTSLTIKDYIKYVTGNII